MNEQAPQEKPVLEPKRGLAEQIKAEHGEDVYRCYQCQKCSAGCPMTFAMDYPPSQIMRMIQLGQEDELLASKTIWACVTCNTCSIRCPNDIDIALVIDSLRERVLQEGKTPAVENVALFHKYFLDNVRKRGRTFEGELLARYQLKTGQAVGNAMLGPANVPQRPHRPPAGKCVEQEGLPGDLQQGREAGRAQMKRIGYYKSCSLNASSNDYARSLEMSFSKLGTRLVPIDDWNCCGASSAHSTNELLGLALPARNLALAEQQGLTTLLVPCSACYSRMLTAAEKIRKNDDLAAEINEVIAPLRYMGTVQVKNILEILWNEVGANEILHAKKHDLGGMKVVCYYGCYLTRTPGVACFDNRENPQSMENLLRMVGAEPLDWPFKTDCCGAGYSLIDAPVTLQLCEKMYDMAHQLGADAIVATCPLCQTNLDVNQDKLISQKSVPYRMPVFYISDLIGVAAGADFGNKLWRQRFVDPRELLNRYALA